MKSSAVCVSVDRLLAPVPLEDGAGTDGLRWGNRGIVDDEGV